ncbi:hypothetical protein, partial [Mesobacillus thioparans]|uniref:hypothetical protein n=1 Tax=Mesobacillus thioparans TaxID=370439 RepID=UPI0039EF72AD
LIRYLILILSAILTHNVYFVIILIVFRRVFDIRLSKVILKENIAIFYLRNISISNVREVVYFYKESIFLSGAQALQININGMIVLIISKVFGLQELGIFRSTFDFLSKIWFFSNGLGMVVFPYFASSGSGVNKNKKYISISWMFYSVIFMISIALFPIINTYILNDILSSEGDLLLYLFLLVGVLLLAQGNLSYEYLQAQGSYKSIMTTSFFTNIVFLVLTYLLYMFFPNLYIVVLSWMISIVIQTIIFERKATNSKSLLLVFSVSVIFIWIALGGLILINF